MSLYSFPALGAILAAEQVLGKVLGPHVFVGGACVGFYVDDPGAAEMRPTDDIDVVVEIAAEADRTSMDAALRDAGLLHDTEGPICRWRWQGLKIDIMPTDSRILGFSNAWYPEALSGATEIVVGGLTIQIPHVCTFLATKIEAFKDRGKGDFIASSDFEDIIRVLEGCMHLGSAVETAPKEVREYVKQTFQAWLQLRDFADAVAAHLLEEGSSLRQQIVYERMGKF